MLGKKSSLDAIAEEWDSEEQSMPGDQFDKAVTFDDLTKVSNVAQQMQQLEEDESVTVVQKTAPNEVSTDAKRIDLEKLPEDVQSSLDSALSAPSTNNSNNFNPALRTKKFELQNFFNSYKFPNYQTNAPFQEFLKKQSHLMPWFDPYKPDGAEYPLKFMVDHISDPEDLISQMPFDMNWDFRNYQIKKMQENPPVEFAKRVGIKLDQNGDPVQGALNNDTFNEKKAYFEGMRNLYAGVSIEAVNDDKGDPLSNIREIKKDGKTLVTITTDDRFGKYGSQLNNVNFKLDPSLKPEELDQALRILIDQATRQQERCRDDQLEISGSNPATVLRVYQLAILEGARPDIHPETREKWEKKAGDRNDPNPPTEEQLKFRRAIDFIDKYQGIAKNNKISKLDILPPELKTMNLKEYLAGQPINNTSTEPKSARRRSM